MSTMGSIAETSGGSNHYRISKVAQNMLARSLFEQHARKRRIAVLSLHPGWVQTKMGGPNALIGVDQSARAIADLIEQEREPGHAFLAYDGAEIALVERARQRKTLFAESARRPHSQVRQHLVERACDVQ